MASLRTGIKFGSMTLIVINVSDLHVDATYQRGLVDSSIDRIVRNFDEAALGVLEVGQRRGSGKYYIVDGQNRHAAVKRMLDNKMAAPTAMLCMVHLNTTREQEANLFVKRNTAKPVVGNSLFKANLTAGAITETEIKQILNDQGFELDFLTGRPTNENTSENGIRSVADLKRAYKACPFSFEFAVMLLRLAFGKGRDQLVDCNIRNGQIIYLLTQFLNEQNVTSLPAVKDLANQIKMRNVHFVQKWIDVRNQGYSRYEEMIQWLRGNLGGTKNRLSLRKAA